MLEGSEFETGGCYAKTAGGKGCVDMWNRQQIGVGRTFLCTTAGTAIARLSHCNSVRLSVCPSVCPSVHPSICLSHGWISQKWSKLRSPNFHYRLPRRL